MSNGYDLVFEVNEAFLNKAMAELFNKGLMSTEGEYQIQLDQIQQELSAFTNIKYNLKLNSPPKVNFTQEGKVHASASAQAVFITLENISLEFDVDISVLSDLSFDKNTNKLILDLVNARIEKLQLEDKYNLPPEVINKFNEILNSAVTSNFTDRFTRVDIPLVLYSQELPFMPEGDCCKPDIEMGGIKVLNSNVMAVCVNLLKHIGGDINAVSDFTGSSDVAAGISEDAIHRVFDFWWNNTSMEKGVSSNTEEDITLVDGFMNFVAPMVNLGTMYTTLGFILTDYHADRAWVEYGTRVTFSKPQFDLKSGNVIDITDLLIKINLWAEVKATITASLTLDTSGIIPDSLTPWKDNIDILRRTTTLTLARLAMDDSDVHLENVKGQIYLDDKNRMVGKVNSFGLNISLGKEWYKYIPELTINKLIQFTESLIRDNVPEFVLFPAVIEMKVPEPVIPFEADIEAFDVFDDESIITANVRITDLQE